ncbi:MAG: TetR/AcrR family transcriptional regulator [Lutibacter sp.]|nr:TetR/AcrR family transcriptional regulator [Lutibacter sp.]
MKETRQTILQKAFIIFLEKGYYGTSITDIQNELDIGRATLYHHFANKEELFFAIIDELFMSMGNNVQNEDTSEMTIKELIDHLKKKLYDEATWLSSKQIGLVDFFILSAEALRLKPEYQEISEKQHEKAINIWSKAIRNSIKKGEVKETIDVTKTAKLFIYVKHGVGILSNRKNLEQSITETQNGYESIYQLIQK